MQFMLRPSISLSPASAKPGTTVSVTGSGFPASDHGTLSMTNGIVQVPINTSSTGTLSATFTVPDATTGSHAVIATTIKLGAEKAQATLQVLSRNVDIPAVPPDEVPSPDNNAQQSYSNGSDINNPVAQPATGTTLLAKPVIIAPRDSSFGWFGNQTVAFQWGPVPEPKNVTYNLEIGSNFNFNPPLSGMQKEGLNSTNISIELPPGKYYWRIKAVDNYGNEGDWSYSPYPFAVGQFPVALLIIAAAIIAVIIIVARIIKSAKRHNDDYYY